LVYWAGTPLYVRRPPQVMSDAAISSEQKREDRKTLLRIVIVFSPLIIFWALYYQLNTSWMQQGTEMRPYYLFGGADDAFSYKIDAQRIQAASAVLILILVPLMAVAGYPLMKKIGLPTSMTGKIAIGLVATAVAFGVSGVLQNIIDA